MALSVTYCFGWRATGLAVWPPARNSSLSLGLLYDSVDDEGRAAGWLGLQGHERATRGPPLQTSLWQRVGLLCGESAPKP